MIMKIKIWIFKKNILIMIVKIIVVVLVSVVMLEVGSV